MPPLNHQSILEGLGLSPNEAKVYELLLSLPDATVPMLSRKLGVHRRNVYDALDRLVIKQFVQKRKSQGAEAYLALHPNNILKKRKEQEQRFQEILPTLEHLMRQQHAPVFVEQYSGNDGAKRLLDILKKTQEKIFSLGYPKEWEQDIFRESMGEMKKVASADWEAVIETRDAKVVPAVFLQGDARFLEKRKKNYPEFFIVAGDVWLLLSAAKGPTEFIVVHSQAVAIQYANLFSELRNRTTIVPRGTIESDPI
ncbi:MAG: helix-turn-helix domain-containing protein [bacterium]